jgi:GntR family transcriptional regulator
MSPKPARTDSRPLYVQVRQLLIERIRSGAWKPGALIPNEFELARQMGVSQGTARKALDLLSSERLVVRRQGSGTYVVEHTPQHVLFRFFNLFDEEGGQILPDSRLLERSVAKASAAERAALALPRAAKVIRLGRVRLRGDTPFIVESIVLPALLFPDLPLMREVPNTLYDLFQRKYGILVVRTDERITAVRAGAREAGQLGIEEGAPLLEIDRIAFGLDDRPVEWRVSRCHLDRAHYLARLR